MIWLKNLVRSRLLLWRRSYDIPPKLNQNESTHPRNDAKYSHIDDLSIPSSESLKDVVERFLPLWNRNILNELKLKKKCAYSCSW